MIYLQVADMWKGSGRTWRHLVKGRNMWLLGGDDCLRKIQMEVDVH